MCTRADVRCPALDRNGPAVLNVASVGSDASFSECPENVMLDTAWFTNRARLCPSTQRVTARRALVFSGDRLEYTCGIPTVGHDNSDLVCSGDLARVGDKNGRWICAI